MKKRGIGIGSMLYVIGYAFSRPDHAGAIIEMAQDGSVLLISGITEFGQGSTTGLAQIAAEELGIKTEQVKVLSGDSTLAPDSCPTSASRSMYVSGSAVLKAVRHLKESLMETASEMLETPADDLVARGGKLYPKDAPERGISISKVASMCHIKGKRCIGFGYHSNVTPDADPKTGQGDTVATFGYATQLAEIEVDTETGWVEVLRFTSFNDAGKAINPLNVEGQVEGGISMGVGFTLHENFLVEEGRPLTTSFAEYLLPTAMDMPAMETFLVEETPDPTGPFGAKGMGEAAAVPAAPAILNAIYNAIGVRITDLPITPEKVLAALQEKTERK